MKKISIFCRIIFTSILARDESINMDLREVFTLFFWLHIWRMSSEGNASICRSHRVRTSSIPFDKRCSAPSGRLKCEWLHLTGVITHAPCKSLMVKRIQGARKRNGEENLHMAQQMIVHTRRQTTGRRRNYQVVKLVLFLTKYKLQKYTGASSKYR